MSTIYINSYVHSGVTYLLRDEFTTDAAAPLASPRTCEPGPGTMTKGADASNRFSIASGKLTASAGNSNYADPFYSFTGQSRAAGVALVHHLRKLTAKPQTVIGWGINTTPGIGAFIYTGNWESSGFRNFGSGEPNLILRDFAINTDYRAAYILRATGCFTIIDGVIQWISSSGNQATLYPVMAHYSNGVEIDYVRVSQLPSPWATDYGIADVHATPGVSATDYTGQADAIIDLAVTAPASLAGETGYWFRKQDATNGYKAYFDSAGAFLVDRYVAGTPTNVVSVAGVITGSGTRTIRTIADGTALRFYTLSGTTWTQRGGTITDSSFSSQTTITPFADGSWTGGGGSLGQLDSWPRTLSGAALAALNAV